MGSYCSALICNECFKYREDQNSNITCENTSPVIPENPIDLEVIIKPRIVNKGIAIVEVIVKVVIFNYFRIVCLEVCEMFGTIQTPWTTNCGIGEAGCYGARLNRSHRYEIFRGKKMLFEIF